MPVVLYADTNNNGDKQQISASTLINIQKKADLPMDTMNTIMRELRKDVGRKGKLLLDYFPSQCMPISVVN